MIPEGETAWQDISSPDQIVRYYDPTDVFGDLAEAIADAYPSVSAEAGGRGGRRRRRRGDDEATRATTTPRTTRRRRGRGRRRRRPKATTTDDADATDDGRR